MALGLQDFIHTFFSAQSIAAADGTVNWASALGTPADYESASTEKVEAMGIGIDITFNASATGSVKIHVRKDSDTGLHTETVTIAAPGSTTVQRKELWVYGPFKNLDIGIENEDGTYSVTATIACFDGTKITGVTAAS